MEGREADYTFSKPYMHNEQVVVVKKDSGISSLDDLAGKNVMTQVAIARGHLGGQINVEAGQVAIVADEAIGRVSVVQAGHN
mgnify:CR=1 FL=1